MARNKRPKTAEEIRKQKRECERKRRACIKANPDLYEASKRKDNLRYAEKRRKKQVKLVSDMTPRERRAKQREWRERKARSRHNKKRNEQLLQSLRENTPESISGDQNVASPDSQQNVSCLSPASSTASTVSRRSSFVNPGSSFSREECFTSSSSSSNLNRQKVAGIRLARKRREESNLKINTQASVIRTLEKKVHALRVQLLRANHKVQQLSSLPKKVATKQILTKKLKPLNSKIIAFLERDDNSKQCPGKKDVITKNKIKKQKRYLCDTLTNLHSKFQIENKEKLSLATFCRMRPFWIVSRQVAERDTCLCVAHENMQLKFDNLKHLGIFNAPNLTELCKSIVCDINKEACMLRKCRLCSHKSPEINLFDGSETTAYKTWCVTKEKRLIKGQEKEIRRTVKGQKIITKKELVESFLEDLKMFLEHQFNISHQYKQSTLMKNNLVDGEIFMQIDFSENYCCKYANEIQSVHFGASRQQISLHTGVYYYRCPDTQKVNSRSFCTFSENLRHDASAICAHLQKMLDLIVSSCTIQKLHILSDGPSAQYRNRYMFYLYTQYLAKRYSLKTATWNFCEAGHGKGPMDGVGAVIKRTADRIVAQGSDIPDFNTLMKCIRENTTNVIISTVTTKEIEEINKLLHRKISSVPGITKVHQMTWDSRITQKIFLRKLTCLTCAPGERCLHYSLPNNFVEFSNPLLQEKIYDRKSEEQENNEPDSETKEQENVVLDSETKGQEDEELDSETAKQEEKELDSEIEEREERELYDETEEQEDNELDGETGEWEDKEQEDKELDSENEELDDRELDDQSEVQEDKECDRKPEKRRMRFSDSESDDDLRIF